MSVAPDDLERGQLWLRAVLIALPLLVAVPTVAGLLQGRTEGTLQEVLYLIATAVLMWNVWRGSVWSWRITVALSMLTGMLVFMAGLLGGETLMQGLVISAAGLAFLLLGLFLVADGPVRRALEARWEARTHDLRRRRDGSPEGRP